MNDRRYTAQPTAQPCERCRDPWCSGCENADPLPERCPECHGTGKVDEYLSRAEYEEKGAPDPVTCGVCRGSGWVEGDV